MNEEKLNEIVADIYQRYGSHTGYLFGILPENKVAVKGVIKVVLDQKVKRAIDESCSKKVCFEGCDYSCKESVKIRNNLLNKLGLE